MHAAQAIASLLLVLAVASPALAYRRATVAVMPDRGLVWDDRAIPIELASGSSFDVSPDELRAALARSIATWNAPSCSDVVLSDVGDAASLTTNLVDGTMDGRHRVVLREEGWPAEVGDETLALTTFVYERSTGRILDADVDLNASAHLFAAREPLPPGADDVENTLTHELGHLIGFSHSDDPEATMFASAVVGDTSKRDLAADDLRALCETYPTGLPTPPVMPPATPAGGCSAAGGVGAPWVSALLLVSARAGARARRRARAAGTAS